MVKTNHVLIQNICPFPISLNSSQPAIKDGKCLLISWKTSHFCSEKKLIEPKKIAETFTFCEKEIAKLYTATSSRLNTSLYLEFN